MNDLKEIYLVVYKELYCGEFTKLYKEVISTPLRVEEFIKTLLKDENVSDIRLYICHEQNIDYLKEN